MGLAILIALPLPLFAQAAARELPTRPAATARPIPTAPIPGTRKFDGVTYVSVTDLAARLGLTATWRVRGRTLLLAGPNARAELEKDTRDVLVNGLRVFLGHPVVDSRGQLYVSQIDFQRCLTPLLRPGFGAAPLRGAGTIVLDPGHGGNDNGTSRHEKTYALDVALRAKKLLEADGYKVVLTRSSDVYVEHTRRAAIANLQRADAFVSIHFNALEKDRKTQGVEVYTFPPQSQNSTNSWSLGQKPNAEDESSPNNAFDHWNVVLAQSLHRELLATLKTPDRGKKLMHLKVLRPLTCPGALIECGFLTSDAEAARIATPAYRQKIAEAVAAGARDFVVTARGGRPAAGPAAQAGMAARKNAG